MCVLVCVRTQKPLSDKPTALRNLRLQWERSVDTKVGRGGLKEGHLDLYKREAVVRQRGWCLPM
jgi:hypothetical protein